jgi:hypothetical protein
MKTTKTILILAALLLGVASVSAQNADEVIAKYVKALGGKEQISKVNSLYTESKADIMGMESVQKTTVLNGVGYKMEMEIMGSTIVTCITENGGWSINPMMGSGAAEDLPEAQYNEAKNQIFVGAPFTVYAEKGYKAEMLGNEAVGTANATKVKLTAPDSTSAVYYFDTETGLLIESVTQGDMQGEQVENTTTYSDYKEVDGYTLPYKINISMGGMFEMTNEVTKVEVNKPVDPAIFAKP